MVQTGPIMPIWAVVPAPRRPTAIMVRVMGMTVQKTALMADRACTCQGWWNMVRPPLSRAWPMQNTLATRLAQAVRRMAPRRRTTSPLVMR